MKICFLSAASIIHTVRWANAMVDRGHQVELITMHHSKLDKIDARVMIHQLKIPAPIGYYLNRIEVKRLLRKIQPDIMNVHYASGYGTLARLADFSPTLLTVWGSDVYLFPYQSRRNEKTLRRNLKSVDQITSSSNAMKEQTENFITPFYPIEVIPFGIDINRFKSNGLVKVDNIVIGTVKKLEHIYGIDILIKATAKLIGFLHLNDYDEIARKIKLQIVGDGSQLTHLQRLAEELDVTKITEFIGAISNDSVPHYLNQFDIYCAFSRSESFGVAVLEASACEAPVVVSHVGGLPEIVQDGKTGFVVDHENIDDVVDKLFQLVMDKEKRKNMGQNGRMFVQRYYDWNQNVSHMEKAYEELIERT